MSDDLLIRLRACATPRVEAMPSLREMYSRAERAIERDEEVIYDVAADCGQLVGNVKRMRWFRRAVAEELFGAAVVADAIAAENFRPICNPR